MGETLAFPKMAENILFNSIWKINFNISNKILKVEGYILKKNHTEQFEIIIFKDFNSSITFIIKIDFKKVFEFDCIVTNFDSMSHPWKERW